MRSLSTENVVLQSKPKFLVFPKELQCVLEKKQM